MRKFYKLVLFIFLIYIFFPVVYSEDTEQDFNIVKDHTRLFRDDNPTLPNAPMQKGRMGEIISKLFDANGKIGNWYIKALGSREDSAVLRWTGGNGGRFMTGSIYDDGTNVGIGVTSPNKKLHVASDTSDDLFSFNSPNARIYQSYSGQDSRVTIGEKNPNVGTASLYLNGYDGDVSGGDYSYIKHDGSNGLLTITTTNNGGVWDGDIAIMPAGNIGISNTNPGYKLDVSGDINFTGDIRKNGAILDIFREIAINKRGESLVSIHGGVGGNGLSDGTPGQPNIYLGPNVGLSNTTGYWNVFLGDDTGRSNTTGHRNVFIGENVGRSHQSGARNVFIGSRSGYSNINGSSNIFMGQNAGYWNTAGGSNVFLGSYAGNDNQSGNSNVFIGLAAGQNSLGDTNVAIGKWAGLNLESGTNNIAIGTDTDFTSATVSNQLNIGNWIYGNNGNIGIGTTTPSTKLEVSGNVRMSGGTGWKYLEMDSETSTKTLKIHYGDASNEVRFGRYADNFSTTWEANPVRFDMDAPTDSLRVVGSGNIGIGTGSPTHKLDLRGQLRLNHAHATYDVWVQGGAATSGDDRNLAFLGYDEDSGDRLVINFNNEYAGGTQIGGKMGIGTSSIPSQLTVEGGGDIASVGDTSASVLIRQGDVRLAIDANEMQSSNNGSASNYAINPFGGNVGIGGFPHSSLKLDVNGKIGASQYCDGSGNNCTNANDLRTKCTALGYGSLELTNSEESSAGLSTSYRYMIMPDSMTRRCRQKGYDFGFALDLFRNQSGTQGWCGYSNARTVYYAGQSHRWRSTSEIGGSCINGSVELGYCCHID